MRLIVPQNLLGEIVKICNNDRKMFKPIYETFLGLLAYGLSRSRQFSV